MRSISLLFLSVLMGFATSVRAGEPVACGGPEGCFPFEYCWNSICRELPPELWGDAVPGYTVRSHASDDLGIHDSGGNDPLEGISNTCRADADCMHGDRCENGVCRNDHCQSDVECGYREICQREHRASPMGRCTLVECTHNYHCGEGHRCGVRNHVCR